MSHPHLPFLSSVLKGLPFSKQHDPSSFRERSRSGLRGRLAMEIREIWERCADLIDRDKARGENENAEVVRCSVMCYVIVRIMWGDTSVLSWQSSTTISRIFDKTNLWKYQRSNGVRKGGCTKDLSRRSNTDAISVSMVIDTSQQRKKRKRERA